MTAFQDQFGKVEAFIVPWMVEPPGNWTDHLKYLEASGQFHMPYYAQEGTPYGTVGWNERRWQCKKDQKDLKDCDHRPRKLIIVPL